MQFDEALQWCIDNKAAYTFSYENDVDGNKIWTAKVSRGIVSAQYTFTSPEELPDALSMACYSVQHGTSETEHTNLMAMLDKFRVKPQVPKDQPVLKQHETLCDHCDAKCCKYVTIGIAAPEDKEDYDWLKFYLLHDNVHVNLDVTGEWDVVFVTKCRFLEGNRCGIHDDTRPNVCLNHNPPYCDYNMSPERFVRFDTPEQIDAYVKMKGLPDGPI